MVTTKTMGMTHSSRSFAVVVVSRFVALSTIMDRPGDKKNATLEKSREGVNIETLSLLSF